MRIIFALFVLLVASAQCFETENDEMTIDQFLQMLKGMFEGMQVEHNMEEIIKCVTKVPEAVHVLMAAIEKITHLDIKNLKEIVELIIQLVGAVKEIINTILPCVSTAEEWKKILEKLAKLDINLILNRLIERIFDIVGQIGKIKEALKKNDYQKLGQGLGGILRIIFLDE